MIRVCALLLLFRAFTSASSSCDYSIKQVPKEGNVGETAIFPWLGVLRVHLHQGDVFKVALTGLVLVKEGFAIANADDVARIPKRIFKEDSKAMFIPTDGKAWFCALLDYMTHPEYEFSTMNTIALVELDPGEDRHFPMKPICWPPYSYNTSNSLYAIGFTDDNQLLEKSVYSLQYVDRKLCEEFYNRAGLVEGKLTPTHYVCGFAKHNQENCVWDNGIVLASNTTSQWKLIGFSIRGPGCAAPARFIDMQPFFPWIESATNFDGDELDYRRSAFNEGFRKKAGSGNSSEEITPDFTAMIQHKYLFETDKAQNAYFSIDRVDAGAINIRNVAVPTDDRSCVLRGTDLVYRDEVRVVTEGEGFASYRLSLYDLHFLNYTCVMISLESISCANATIYYTAKIDNWEGTSFRDFGTTPEHLLQTIPIHPRTPRPKVPTTTNPSAWKPGPHLKAAFIKEEAPYINIENYNIYFKFQFRDEGIIDLKIYGPQEKKKRKAEMSTTTEDMYDLRMLKNKEEVDYEDYDGNTSGAEVNGTDAKRNRPDTQSNGTHVQEHGTDAQSNGIDAQGNEATNTSATDIRKFEHLRIDRKPTSSGHIERPLISAGVKIETARRIQIIVKVLVSFCIMCRNK